MATSPKFPMPTALARRFLARVPDGALRDATERLVARADQVMEQLARTSAIMERVAEAELSIVQRLGGVVDDLGQLVKLQLADARRRLGRGAEEPVHQVRVTTETIIDVEET